MSRIDGMRLRRTIHGAPGSSRKMASMLKKQVVELQGNGRQGFAFADDPVGEDLLARKVEVAYDEFGA